MSGRSSSGGARPTPMPDSLGIASNTATNSTSDNAMAPPEKKRRRPALACEQCRRRKIRCDRNVPCSQCLRSKTASCSYAPTHTPASWTRRSHKKPALAPAGQQPPIASAPSVGASSGDGSGPSSVAKDASASASGSVSTSVSVPDAPDNVDWLVARVHHLEEKLSKVVNLGGPDENDHESPEGTQSSLACPTNGTVSKTRYFGRSHWMNGTTLIPFQMEMLARAELEKGNLAALLNRCKSLGRTIKRNRLQPLSTEGLGQRNMPSREVADRLVEAYLRSFEGVLRILHVPSFRAEYERYWHTPAAASDFFPIQLQLVMALGAVVDDDTFSRRALATQWIYEAQLWLMLPPEKRCMTLAGIQIMCLLTLARAVCAVGQDLVWITTGGLIRNAMHMGLHRDPRHLADMTTYRAEMRRRLWATILELNLQSSFDAGGPPLISALDYDTRAPANLDDDQLGDHLDRERIPAEGQPPDVVTQMSIPLELSKSLPLRLTLLRHANDFRAGDSYDETLRFNSDLTKACRSLSHRVALILSRSSKQQQQQQQQQHQPGERPAAPRPTDFHASVAELLLYRCFHTLHLPVISRSLDDPRFYFSRKMYLDGALKITHICGLSGPRRADGPGRPHSDTGNSPADDTGRQTDLDRLLTNGSGTFRNTALQSLPPLVIELLQIRRAAVGGGYGGEGPCVEGEGEGLGLGLGLGYLPAVHDYDLRATIEAGRLWMLRRIRSGETNIKGHCFAAACLRHLDAVEAGGDRAATKEAILQATEESGRLCYEVLKELAEREGVAVAEEEDEKGEGEGMQKDSGEDVLGMETGVGGQVGVEGMTVDFMGDWTWDDMNDMNGLLWGSPGSFDDHHLPIFG
ncbi:hypothetical protein ACO1O0_004671 [Amphichorda felina]